MRDPTSPPDPRHAYEDILVRAGRLARRFVSREQAFEIGHDVAVELLQETGGAASATLVYFRVTSRLRNLWRARDRRAVLDRAYLDMRSSVVPAWARPDTDFEEHELRALIDDVLSRMPRGMREVFLLVREEELSYKEAAAHLGISVSTVHTQLSRANALFRECVAQYHSGAISAPQLNRRSP